MCWQTLSTRSPWPFPSPQRPDTWKPTLFVLAAAFSVTAPGIATAASDAIDIRKVAITGDHAPGQGESARATNHDFVWFGNIPGFPDTAPRISPDGFVSLSGGFGDGTLDDVGLFFETADGLQVLTVVGDPAPGTSVDFEAFPGIINEAARITSGGRVAFSAQVTTSQFPEQGIWHTLDGTTEQLYLQSSQPPGTPAGSRYFGWAPGLRGDFLLVNASYTEPGQTQVTNQGFWRFGNGVYENIVLSGEAAPGLPNGVEFGGPPLPFRFWDLNAQGAIVFSAFVEGVGTDPVNNEGIWLETPTGLELIVRENDLTPPQLGLPAGTRFANFGGFKPFEHDHVIGVSQSGNGNVLFGSMTDVPGNTFPGTGVYSYVDGELELIALGRSAASDPPADPAPGFPEGTTIASLLNGRITDAGFVAFSGFVRPASAPTEAREHTPNESVADELLPSASDSDFGFADWNVDSSRLGADGSPSADYSAEAGLACGSAIWWNINGELERAVACDGPIEGLPDGFVISFPAIQRFEDPGYIYFTAIINNDVTHRGLFLTEPSGVTHFVVDNREPFDVDGNGDIRVPLTMTQGIGMSDEFELTFDLRFTDDTEGVFVASLRDVAGTPDLDTEVTGPSILTNSPNPFRAETEIRFELVNDEDVAIDVFDSQGRRVANLYTGSKPAGQHAIRWDGSLDSGAAAAHGVYFVRFETESKTVSKRITKVR